jgi:hypothetical protein
MADRENEAVDQSPEIPEKETRDDELGRLAGEQKHKEKKGDAFIPEDELIDPETENFEDLIVENIDAHRPVGLDVDEYDPSAEGFKKTGEFESKNRNYIPFAIWKIKRKYSLPGIEWKKLSRAEQIERNKKKQEEINELYIHKEPIEIEKKKAA